MSNKKLAKWVLSVIVPIVGASARADYLETAGMTKRVELNPVGLAVGTLAMSFSAQNTLRNFLGLKVMGTQAKFENTKMEGFGLGIVDTYALTAGVDHPVLRGEIGAGRLGLRDSSKYTGERRIDYFNTRGLAGYSWNWPSGLGIIASAGFGYINGSYRGADKATFRFAGAKMDVKNNNRFALVHPDAELAVAYSF